MVHERLRKKHKYALLLKGSDIPLLHETPRITYTMYLSFIIAYNDRFHSEMCSVFPGFLTAAPVLGIMYFLGGGVDGWKVKSEASTRFEVGQGLVGF